MLKIREFFSTKRGERVRQVIEVVLFLISAIGYTVVLGPLGAGTLLGFILIHEGGHAWAMERVGIRVKGLYFLPFLGALVTSENDPFSYEDEFIVAIMGSTMDLMLVSIALAGYLATQSVIFLAVAVVLALSDLFNLLPVFPLDGGLMVKSIAFSLSPKIKVLLIALGFLVGSLACGLITLANVLSLHQVGIEVSRFSIPLLLFAFFLFNLWILYQALSLAKEEKESKMKMTKAKVAFHSVWYIAFIGVLLLVIISCLSLIITNPKGLLDFTMLRLF